MFPFRRPIQPLPSRDFPLVLRHAWRTDLPNPRLGRLRALEQLSGPRTERPPSMIERARRGRIVALNRLTFDDISRVERFGLHRVPADVLREIEMLRAVRDAIAAE